VTLKGQTHDPNTLRVQYLENSWIERLRSKGTQKEMAYGLSNDHVTNDVT